MPEPQNQDTWTEKYLREYPFMPFGSMMNAYAILNKGSVDSFDLEKFKKDAKELFKLSLKLVSEANQSVSEEKRKGEELDL